MGRTELTNSSWHEYGIFWIGLFLVLLFIVEFEWLRKYIFVAVRKETG